MFIFNRIKKPVAIFLVAFMLVFSPLYEMKKAEAVVPVIPIIKTIEVASLILSLASATGIGFDNSSSIQRNVISDDLYKSLTDEDRQFLIDLQNGKKFNTNKDPLTPIDPATMTTEQKTKWGSIVDKVKARKQVFKGLGSFAVASVVVSGISAGFNFIGDWLFKKDTTSTVTETQTVIVPPSGSAVLNYNLWGGIPVGTSEYYFMMHSQAPWTIISYDANGQQLTNSTGLYGFQTYMETSGSTAIAQSIRTSASGSWSTGGSIARNPYTYVGPTGYDRQGSGKLLITNPSTTTQQTFYVQQKRNDISFNVTSGTTTIDPTTTYPEKGDSLTPSSIITPLHPDSFINNQNSKDQVFANDPNYNPNPDPTPDPSPSTEPDATIGNPPGTQTKVINKTGFPLFKQSLDRFSQIGQGCSSTPPKFEIDLNALANVSKNISGKDVSPFSQDKYTFVDFAVIDNYSYEGYKLMDLARLLISFGLIYMTVLYCWRKIVPDKAISGGG